VTFTFDLLTLNSYHTWLVTCPTLPPSLKTLRLFVHELRVITVLFDYHWKYVHGQSACDKSRDPWIGGQKWLHFWNTQPRFAYSLYNFYWAPKTIKGCLLSSLTNAKALDCVDFCAWPCDIDLWPFDLDQLSFMAGHVVNTTTKFEDPTIIRSWVTSYNGSHWLPLKMRTRPLRMRRITRPMSSHQCFV